MGAVVLLSVLLAVVAAIITTVLFTTRRGGRKPKVKFIGPHCSGKTSAIFRLCGIDGSTVPTLGQHSYMYDGLEIVECPPSEASDFFIRFHIEPGSRHVFFVKNEEDLQHFPDLTGYNIVFVTWRRMEGSRGAKNQVCLDESADKLRQLVKV